MYSRSVKAYYHARAREYDDWWLGRGPFADRDRPGLDEERTQLEAVVASLPALRTRSTSPAAPASSRGTCAARSPGSTRATRCSRSPGSRRRMRPSSRATRSTCRSRMTRSTACSPATSTATSRRTIASAFSPRPAVSRPSSSWLRALEGGVPSPRATRSVVLQDGSRWQVFKRVFRPEELVGELGGGEILHLGHYFLVVRSPVTRRRSSVPLARLPPARQPGLPSLRRSRLPAGVAAGRSPLLRPARVHVRTGPRRAGRAGTSPVAGPRGPHAPRLARAGRGRVLRDVLLRLRNPLLSGKSPVRARRPHAFAARAGAVRLLARLGNWSSIRPRLIVTVGGLALKRLLGLTGLAEHVGRRYVHGEATVVPLPHPSGASSWLNDPRTGGWSPARWRRSARS